MQGQQLGKEVAQEVEQHEQPTPDLPHRCKSCSTPIPFRNGMCKTCSDAVIAANSSLQSESRRDKPQPKPEGNDDDPDREFRRAV